MLSCYIGASMHGVLATASAYGSVVMQYEECFMYCFLPQGTEATVYI